MKKILLQICLFTFLLFSFSKKINAQQALGVGMSYSSSLEKPAIHLKFSTIFGEKLGSAVEYESYFLEDNHKWSTVSLHFTYKVIVKERFNFYLLGGGHYIAYNSNDLLIDAGDSHQGTTYSIATTLSGAKGTEIGARLGLGLNHFFTEHIKLFVETKMTFNPRILDLVRFGNLSPNQIIPTVGVAYHF